MFGFASPSAASGSMAVGGAVTAATSGGLLFTDASNQLAQDPTVLFWDDTNNRLGIGNAAPATALHVTGTVRATAGLTLDFLTATRIPFAGASGAITDSSLLTFVVGSGTLSATALQATGLTSGRIPIVGTSGLIGDDADLTFSVDTLTATKLVGTTSITTPSLTAGRVTFAGTGGLLTDDADMTFAVDTLTVTKLSTTNLLSATTQSLTLNSVLSMTVGVAALSTPDADVVFGVGRCLIDSRTPDTVNFSHRDNTGSTSWAMQFGASGFVGLNALTGSIGVIRANNVNKFAWSTVGIAFFNTTIVAQQTGPALNLTNNITSGGTDGTFTNWTDLSTYATDAAAIRNAVYQLARSVKFCSDAMRAYGLLT